jgi:hypothetical protein
MHHRGAMILRLLASWLSEVSLDCVRHELPSKEVFFAQIEVWWKNWHLAPARKVAGLFCV